MALHEVIDRLTHDEETSKKRTYKDISQKKSPCDEFIPKYAEEVSCSQIFEDGKLISNDASYYISNGIEGGYVHIHIPQNGQAYVKSEDGVHKEFQMKDGKKEGLYREYCGDEVSREIPYKNGKKNGFEKVYINHGVVSSMKYWKNGKDCTAEYNRLKKIASKHVAEEDKLSEGKDKREILERKSKAAKKIDFAFETVKDKLHLR